MRSIDAALVASVFIACKEIEVPRISNIKEKTTFGIYRKAVEELEIKVPIRIL